MCVVARPRAACAVAVRHTARYVVRVLRRARVVRMLCRARAAPCLFSHGSGLKRGSRVVRRCLRTLDPLDGNARTGSSVGGLADCAVRTACDELGELVSRAEIPDLQGWVGSSRRSVNPPLKQRVCTEFKIA